MIFTKLDKFKKLPTPRVYMPRAALGVDFATTTTTIRRGADEEAGQARPYAEGPDFWPSAYKRPSAYRAIPVVTTPLVGDRAF